MAGNKKSSKTTKSKSSKSAGDVAVETALSAVKALPADQQVAALTTHYAEMAAEQAQLKANLAAAVSNYETAERSRAQLNTDYTKAMLSKAQLESLCRELQKQNKLIKEENLARIREEEEKRRDVSTRLNSTMADFTGLMQQNTEKNAELRKENQGMATRLNDLVKQYEARQQNVDQILKQRDLQLQLAEARLAKTAIETAEEREVFLKDKKKMLEEMQAYQEKITRMSATEITLRSQLTKYSEQYDEFQRTVQSSNTVMNKFKKEMELMTKKIKKLEKETVAWQAKWQKSNATILDMVTERATLLSNSDKLSKQNSKLQQLARTLQETLVLERKGNAAASLEQDALVLSLQTELNTEEANQAAPEAGITSTSEVASLPSTTVETASTLPETCCKLVDSGSNESANASDCVKAETLSGSSEVCANASVTCPMADEGCTRSGADMDSQLVDIQTKLSDIKCSVERSSLGDVTTKESTIEITEL